MNKAPIIETGLSSLNAVEDTISQRRSLRGFLDKPVDREIIERILFWREGTKRHKHATLAWTCHDG
ncbi:MAG: hypothetical protein CM15mP62_32020 [Rhodospirillaceae bacterium]|nr:MAG: hypothetical protein CM15mP62_32020 [Rhodospirillaceae bacterium]